MHSKFPPTMNIKTFGDSMLPFYKDGDILTIKKKPWKKIQINDLITFKKDGLLITHRVIYRTEKYLITKGDNSYYYDGKIYPQQIIGKIEKIKRNKKTFEPDNIYRFQSQLYFKEIKKITTEFKKLKVDFVFLKGLPVYLHYEKTYPRRFYADCDVLINRNDLEKVDQLFKKLSYQRENKHLLSPIKDIKKVVELSYFKIVNNLAIVFDIHLEPAFLAHHRGKFNILYSQSIMDNLTLDFLSQKKYIEIFNESFPILSPTHQIIYLALHYFHHNYKGISHLEFLNKVLIYYQRNKDLAQKTVALALKYKLKNFIFPSFFFLNKYYKNTSVKLLLKKLKPKGSKSFLTNKILNETIMDSDHIRYTNAKHFINLFILSEENLLKKLLIFTNPSVIYSLIRSLYQFSYIKLLNLRNFPRR